AARCASAMAASESQFARWHLLRRGYNSPLSGLSVVFSNLSNRQDYKALLLARAPFVQAGADWPDPICNCRRVRSAIVQLVGPSQHAIDPWRDSGLRVSLALRSSFLRA